LLVEVIYVRLSLEAMNRILRHKRLLMSLEWVTLVIITALAIASFYAASHPSVHRNPLLSNAVHRFWLGAGMSALNPLQIPFWFGWSTVLFNRGVLRQQGSDFNAYILGIGLGTFLGNAVFIFGGRLLVDRLNANQHVLNWFIGGIFVLTALIQLVRMLRHDDAISRMKEADKPF